MTWLAGNRQAAADLNTAHGSWAHAAASGVGTTAVELLNQTVTSPFTRGGLLRVLASCVASGSAAGARPAIILVIEDSVGGVLRRNETSPRVDATGGEVGLMTHAKQPIAAGETLRIKVLLVNRSGTGTVSAAAGNITPGASNVNYSDAEMVAGAVLL